MTVPGRSILLRLVLLTSVLLTIIFGLTGCLLDTNISRSATRSVEIEVDSSFRAYEALWQEHTENLARMSRVISRMADVRAAFMTNDNATIQDTAQELWARVSSGHSCFTVADGTGKVIASLGDRSPFRAGETLSFVPQSAGTFPAQRLGFLQRGNRLLQIVVTPVYVDGGRTQELLTVLVTGFELDPEFLHALKMASGGSDLIFKLHDTPLASTLYDKAAMVGLGAQCGMRHRTQAPVRLQWHGVDYLGLTRPLPSLMPGEAGELCIVRSLGSSQQLLGSLLHRTFLLYLAGLIAAILCTYAVVRRMLQPVAVLDRAAAKIAGGDYNARVDVQSDDELGRLAGSFNVMCASLEKARLELIRHERLASVARLATFVVHDLRNPLASIYAGAEMLVDNDLPDKQIKRLARNMYTASRGMMEILGDLLSASRSEAREPEVCSPHELVLAAWSGLAAARRSRDVTLSLQVPNDLEIMLDRGPMERVFHNLLENAIEAICDSGRVTVRSELVEGDNAVLLHVEDTGRGLDPEVRPILFQPFASKGRIGGMGLGLALSRQTVLANGGDLTADLEYQGGSHFLMRLPLSRTGTSPTTSN